MNFSMPVKKAVSLLLTAVLIMTLFGGCGKTAEQEKTNSSSQSEETAGTTQNTEEENESGKTETDTSKVSDTDAESESDKSSDNSSDKADKTNVSTEIQQNPNQ